MKFRKEAQKKRPTYSQQPTKFYRGRTAVSQDSANRIRQQKEYRRKNLSRTKRDEFKSKVFSLAKLVIVVGLLFGVVNLLKFDSVIFNSTSGSLQQSDNNYLQNISADYLSGVNSFRPFFNKQDYRNNIVENTTFISDASVKTSLFNTKIVVTVEEKVPVYKFKTSFLPEDGKSFWLAGDGTMIELDDSQSTENSFGSSSVVIEDNSGVDYKVGEPVLSIDQLEYIKQSEILFDLEGRFQVDRVVFEDGPRELRYHFSNIPYYILVSTERPASVLVDDLKKVLTSIESRGIVVSEYIDLRVVDKAFYK